VSDEGARGSNDRRAAARWRAARVVEVAHPSVDTVMLRLAVPERVQHLPGQHYIVRLRAPDGYVAQRSYSVASAPGDELIELLVERIDGGEVSTYLADVVEPGDDLEVRGPIGRWFVWSGRTPAVGIGGGSGVAPLVAMLRNATDLGHPERLRLAASATTHERLPYAGELEKAGARIALTREPGGARLDAEAIAGLVDPAATVYVCGSARFTLAMEDHLLGAGQPAATIRVERFGPTGAEDGADG
jgi:ferredoxin-NADP reductase